MGNCFFKQGSSAPPFALRFISDHPAEDAALEAQIEAEVTRALGPYVAIYPPELMDEAKRLLRFSLRNDPATRQRLRLLRADPIVDDSGKVATGAFRANGAAKRAAKGGAK